MIAQRPPSPALTVVLASILIVSAWLIVMVGLARGMAVEGPTYVPDVQLVNERTP